MNYCDFNIEDLDSPCEINGKFGYDELLIFSKYAIVGYSTNDITAGGFTYANPGNVVTALTPRTVATEPPVIFSTYVRDARAVKFASSAKSMSGGTTFNTTQKTLQFVIKNNGAAISNAITALKNSEFVVAAKRPAPYLQHSAAMGMSDQQLSDYNASMIELFGLESKMRVTAVEQVLAGDDADGSYYGGYLVTLQCTEISDSIYYADNAISSTAIDASCVEKSWETLLNLTWDVQE